MSVDSILLDFDQHLDVSQEENDTFKSHPRFSHYKTQYKQKLSQEERRRKYLENQHSNRQKILIRFRNLIDDDFELGICDMPSDNEDGGEMDIPTTAQLDVDMPESDKKGSQQPKQKFKFKNQLMLSEWLVDVPTDFSTNWLMAICPVGKRCLVVSKRGETKAYARNGFLIGSFSSLLPGGNRRQVRQHKESCVLDCIFSESQQTYFILDLIWWNSASFLDSEAEFRFFWLDTRLSQECCQVAEISKYNRYKFVPLRHFACTPQEMTSAIRSCPYNNEIDGLLFFHKRVCYSPGRTPLVCWLKLDMLQQILGITLEQDECLAIPNLL